MFLTCFIAACLTVVFYFLPTIVAIGRGKVNVCGIFIGNILLGWTVIGWFILMIVSVHTSQVDIMKERILF